MSDVIDEILAEGLFDKIRAYDGDSSFIHSLREQYLKKGQLSERQLAAAAKFFAPRAAAPSVKNLLPLVEFLRNAETNLKSPRLHIEIGGVPMQIKLKRGGMVDLVTAERFWQEKFGAEVPLLYLRVFPDGTVRTYAGCSPLMIAAMEEIAESPIQAAIKYAAKTGNCMFCGLLLRTKESVTAGYGPVCASHWGLPWGEVREVKSS